MYRDAASLPDPESPDIKTLLLALETLFRLASKFRNELL